MNLIDDMDIEDMDDDNDVEDDYENDVENDDGTDTLPPETTSSDTARVRGTCSLSRRRGKCWKNYIVGQKYSDGRTDITCKYCAKNYCLNLRRNGTNALNRHSKTCSKTPGSTPKSSYRKLDMLVFREMIAVALIQHNLPYSFVEYEKVREAFTYANPTIEFWSRNTAASDVYKIFEKEKKKLKETLSNIPGRICLTTDLWRAITIEGYICLTAHYIDVDWVLKTKILSFCAFPPPHTGIAIVMKLVELLKEWGLQKKVFSLTVENAQLMTACKCSAHILNLIVQDELLVTSGALNKIRDSVKYVKGSESRENLFQSCMETVGIQVEAGLVLDVTTRWNSTYLMLSRALEFKDVFCNLAEVDRNYKSLPSDLEWERAEMI